MNIFLFIVCLIIYITIIATMYSGTKPNKNVLLGVTLPAYAIEDERVKAYQKEYKKMLKIYSAAALILLIPMLFINKYFSIEFTYMMLWVLGMAFTLEIPHSIIHKKMMKLKKENEWFVGKMHVVSIDTTVSRLKKASAVSPFWYLIPLYISIIPGLMYIEKKGTELLLCAILSPCLVIMLFLISRSFLKMKSKVYSENTDINLAINSQNKRLWSIVWLTSAFCQSLMMLFTQRQILSVREINAALFIFTVIFFSLLNIILLVYVFIKDRTTQNQLLANDEKQIYTDDDEYWINGTTYCNPNDSSIMVEKRLGIGSTINIGTKAGKIINYGAYLLIAAIIIPICAFTIMSDFVSPTIEISDSRVINIKCPMYNYSFNMDEVEDITLVDKLPGGIKTNGAATDTYARGNFNLDGYGRTKAYIFKNNPPYIVIKLKDIYVIYNEKDRNRTREVYSKLINSM